METSEKSMGSRKSVDYVLIGYLVIVLAAFLLRFYDLGAMPYHHDEGVHGFFTYNLYKDGSYHYDPTYHGPFLYHVTAAIFYLFGDSDFTARILPALLGVGLVALVYPLRKQLGDKGTLIAGTMLTISPAFLYFSRFFRNDIMIVFFTLGMIACMFKYLEKNKAWYLYAGSVLLACSLTCKENAYITLFILVTFAALNFMRKHRGLRMLKEEGIPQFGSWLKSNALNIIICAAIVAFVYTMFYSSFFTKLEGVGDTMLRGITFWVNMHHTPRIPGPFFYYIPLMFLYELPVIVLAIFGCVYYASKKETDEFMLFGLYWMVAILLIYSYVQEKVPWLMLHVALPMVIVASRFMNDVLSDKVLPENKKMLKNALIVFFVAGMLFSAASSIKLSYFSPADPHEPMVFVQTSPDIPELIQVIEKTAQETGVGKQLRIMTVDTEYWPLPWYLRHYKNVGYHSSIPSGMDAPIIITHDTSAREVRRKLTDDYASKNMTLRAWYVASPEDFSLDMVLYRKLHKEVGRYGLVVFYDQDVVLFEP